MSTLEVVLQQIDQLSEDDRHKLQGHLDTQKRTMMIYTVSGEQMKEMFDILEPMRRDAENMSEEELDAFFSEVIAEVRAERRNRQ